jgi:UDP-galactopyranose mutase
MESVERLLVGAGVIGLAIAPTACGGRDVIVVESGSHIRPDRTAMRR